MNIKSYSMGRGFNALSESKADGLTTTDGKYYSPHGIVSCYSETHSDGSHAGTHLDMVLLGRQWNYGDRQYRGVRALGRLAAKFAREIVAKKND